MDSRLPIIGFKSRSGALPGDEDLIRQLREAKIARILKKTAECNDDELFTEMACHVFAVSLLERIGRGRASLWRIARGTSGGRDGGLHVVVRFDEYFFDVAGKWFEQDLLQEWSKPEHSPPGEPLGLLPCSEDELLSGEPKLEGVRLNPWNHLVDEAFLPIWKARADANIGRRLSEFGISPPQE